jgi:hypothetical protein
MHLQVDGLASIGAHEIIEWITDPDGDAWYETPPEHTRQSCHPAYFVCQQIAVAALSEKW